MSYSGGFIKLNEVANVIDSLHKTPKYSQEGYSMVRVTDIKGGYLNLKNTLKVSKEVFEEFSKKYKPTMGDIVFSRVGSYGISSLVVNNESFCLGQNTVVIVPKNINGKFLYYVLNSPYTKSLIEERVTGSTQKTISLKNIRSLLIPIVDEKTQIRIASVLSSFDEKIHVNRQINILLEGITQILFGKYFIKNNNRTLVNIEEYIEFNPKLSIKKGQMATFLEMKAVPNSSMNVKYTFLKAFKSGMKFQNYDTLLARITPCLENGKTAFVNFLEEGEIGFGSTEFVVMHPKADVSPQFVYCLARNKDLRQHAINSMVGSSGRQRVQLPMLKRYKIKKVDFRLMKNFDEITKPIFERIKINGEEIQRLARTRDLLLPKLMSGEIEV